MYLSVVVLALKTITTKHVQKKVSSVECSTGFITLPGNKKYNTNDFCVMKYEAESVNGTPKSQADKTPWVDISQSNAIGISKKACSGCHLITENEWLMIAQNIMSVPSNWSLNIAGGGYTYAATIMVRQQIR